MYRQQGVQSKKSVVVQCVGGTDAQAHGGVIEVVVGCDLAERRARYRLRLVVAHCNAPGSNKVILSISIVMRSERR